MRNPFARIKKTTFSYDENKRTVTMTDVPWEFINSVLTQASLYNYLSLREYRVGDSHDEEYIRKENQQYCEAQRRQLAWFQAAMKATAYGEQISQYTLKDVDDEALENWIRQEEERATMLAGLPPKEPVPVSKPLGEPHLSIYRARLLMLQLMQEMSYVSNTVVGLSRKNYHNQASFARQHLAKMPKLIRDIKRNIERFERLYQAEGAQVDDQQPIERAFS